jgi:hypothetical protein
MPVDVEVVLATSPGWLCTANRHVGSAHCHSSLLMTALRHRDTKESTTGFHKRMQDVADGPCWHISS